MNKNEYVTLSRLAFRLAPKLNTRMIGFTNQGTPISSANVGSGGPDMEMSVPPGFSTRNDLSRVHRDLDDQEHPDPPITPQEPADPADGAGELAAVAQATGDELEEAWARQRHPAGSGVTTV
jgi:hypothetical protein